MPRREKHYRAKVLRKTPALPITFHGRSGCGVRGEPGSGDGVDSVAGGVTGVTSHVGSPCGMTRGAGGGTCRTFTGVASGGVGGHCGGARFTARYLAPYPGTSCFNGFARSIVLRALSLEKWKHMLGTVSGPERK